MANLVIALEMTSQQVTENSLSTPAGIYLAQLTNTQSSITIGNFIPDSHGNIWFYVGPGSRPSVQQLSGTIFLLMFEYLSHMTIRAVDVSTWPPTQVDPLSIEGGPNPPNPFTYGMTQTLDAYALRREGASSGGVSQLQLSPPYLKKVNITVTPATNTYSVTLQPDPTWVPNIAGTTLYYRLYISPLGPPSWTLLQDWTTTLDYTYSQVGAPFQWQFAATVGVLFNPSRPNDPTQHNESAYGAPEAFNSATQSLEYVETPSDSYTLEQLSSDAFGIVGARPAYYALNQLSDSLFQQWIPNWTYLFGDEIVDQAGHVQQVVTPGTSGATYPAFESGPTTPDGTITWEDQGTLQSILGEGTSGFSSVGARQLFFSEVEADTMSFGQQVSPPLAGGNAGVTVT